MLPVHNQPCAGVSAIPRPSNLITKLELALLATPRLRDTSQDSGRGGREPRAARGCTSDRAKVTHTASSSWLHLFRIDDGVGGGTNA